ncbi:transposase [Ralstonia pickettii]|jgi:hypothetical protein|nr:transposase [Ralstonia insidiosa]MBA9884373.1 transposase [Ralstonia pickettii]MBA9894139.1 transposase [Ralstonia pickettii]MBA9913680.1 transposase [Ralstonia insidiosa]MBA9926192.1 transposase [Ralstonia pickettii]
MDLEKVRLHLPKFERDVAIVAEKMGDHQPSVIVYVEVLRHLVRHEASGACHKYSAILYVLLSELEAQLPGDADEVSLRIGVVLSPDGEKFDHSWVQYGPGIYDAAVCLPSAIGGQTGGPVFASHDLLTGQFVHGRYTQLAALELDDDAQRVARWTLSDYADYIAQEGALSLWEIVVEIGNEVGFPLNAEALRVKYGGHLRVRADH